MRALPEEGLHPTCVGSIPATAGPTDGRRSDRS